MKPLLITVSGPTASGKTDLAIQLKKTLPVELINMDSAQIYTGMDIGTSKISKYEQLIYPHHLIDIISPEQNYSVSNFISDVSELIPNIRNNNNIPLLVGGTSMYLKCLIEGIADLPSADNALRESLNLIIKEKGRQYLYDELKSIDPYIAKQISVNDTQRLVRFVEIYRLTGRSPTEIFSEQKNNNKFQFFNIVFLPKDRSILHERISHRFNDMIEQGFIQEVKMLKLKYDLHSGCNSMKCVGYRQVLDYLDGKYDNLPIKKNNKYVNTPKEELINRGIFATRQLAKRQITQLKKIPADYVIHDLAKVDVCEIARKITKLINSHQFIKK